MNMWATRNDRIHNGYIQGNIGVTPIKEKMTENQLRWLWHVQKRPLEALGKKVRHIGFSPMKWCREGPRGALEEIIKIDFTGEG
ncbi:hypothetical protein CR513_14842, partial [Mucuna pruriens]